MLRSLVVMKHFRATKSGAGFTIRQLTSWIPSSCGVSVARSTLLPDAGLTKLTIQFHVYMGQHFKQILYFLAAAIDVPSTAEVTRDARASGADPDKACAKTAKDLMEASSSETRPLLHVLDSVYLEPWSEAWIDTMGDKFELIASSSAQESKEWDRMSDQYWERVLQIVKEAAEDVDPNSRDPADELKRSMERKIHWVRSGHLLPKHAPFLQKMPLPNKYIFSSMQKLFCDDTRSFKLHDIIKWASFFFFLRFCHRAL
jgi:hypothetical protein